MFSSAQIALVKIINIFTVLHIATHQQLLLAAAPNVAASHMGRGLLRIIAWMVCKRKGVFNERICFCYCTFSYPIPASDSFPIFTVIWKSFPKRNEIVIFLSLSISHSLSLYRFLSPAVNLEMAKSWNSLIPMRRECERRIIINPMRNFVAKKMHESVAAQR